MAIEPFELHDNLMLAGGIADSGGCLITETVRPPALIWLAHLNAVSPTLDRFAQRPPVERDV